MIKETSRKFKLTLAVEADLRRRAALLPKVTTVDADGKARTRRVQVPGSKLTQADMAKGHTLKPNLMYITNEFILVDHYQTMVSMYQASGMGAVNDYEAATKLLKKVGLESLRPKETVWSKLKELGRYVLGGFSSK